MLTVTIIACMVKQCLLLIIDASLTTAIAREVRLCICFGDEAVYRYWLSLHFFFSTTTFFIAVKTYVICALRQNECPQRWMYSLPRT